MSDEPRTTITSYSPVSRAIGVTWSRVTGDWLVRMAPTMTSPLTISALPSPFLRSTNWASPTVPPAPPTFSTWTEPATPDACIDSWIERAVWSQPTPGFAGAYTYRLSHHCACHAGAAPAAPNPPTPPHAPQRPKQHPHST